MLKLTLRSIALALSYLMVFTGHAHAAITASAGRTCWSMNRRSSRAFDSAFDTINRIYLVVWGTQANGPVNGMFLNEAGAAITGTFRDLEFEVKTGGPFSRGGPA